MKSRKITYEEFQAIGKKYYNQGGSYIVECWEKYQFDDYCKMFGPMTERDVLNMINLYEETDKEEEAFRKWASGEPDGGWNNEYSEEEPEEYCSEFFRGLEEEDRDNYSPSAPWNAPGMSVSDFI